MNGRGALDGRIKPIGESSTFSGVALPVPVRGPADNLAAFGALSIARPGDVVVCGTDSFTETAVTGDLLLGMMKNRGVAAFVTDGFVRDLQGMGRACLVMRLTPISGTRTGRARSACPSSWAAWR